MEAIRTTPRPKCDLCHHAALPMHEGLRDRLFGSPGSWSIVQCSNPRCGLLWMDPVPLSVDLALAYAGYYTHVKAVNGVPTGNLKRIYQRVKRSYLAARYGYWCEGPVGSHLALGLLMYLFPVRRSSVDDEVRRLKAQVGGKLLDVGCGSGAWLADMRERGWRVSGVDFDGEAVAAAEDRGLDVRLGSLAAQQYPDESFDVVTLNQVLEHVPDPVETLVECRRILRPGGQFVLYTPNSRSLAHRLFVDDWRGLEPPRHLQIFGPNSMVSCLSAARFTEFEVTTVNSEYIWAHSLGLWLKRPDAGESLPAAWRLLSHVLAGLEQVWLTLDPLAGECLAVHARK